MSSLSEHLDRYLAMRQRLGFAGSKDPFTLRSFVQFCQDAGHETITTDAVVEWVTAPAGADRSWLAKRFSVVRLFAQHVHAIDPAHQVPPGRLFTGSQRRRIPHIYTPDEITGLIDAAGTLRGQLRPVTYQTLIGLLAVTGMRISEAIALDDDHLDLNAGVITIVASKFNKSRQLPLHPSTLDALSTYITARGHRVESALLVTDTSRRIHYRQCQATFADCLTRAGLPDTPKARPTLHDFRHSFAVNTLCDWYGNDDVDVAAMLPYLSAYLGHINPKSTYWYLSAVPELAAVIARRLDLTARTMP